MNRFGIFLKNSLSLVGAISVAVSAFTYIQYKDQFKKLPLNIAKNISISKISTAQTQETLTLNKIQLIAVHAPKLNLYKISNQNVNEYETVKPKQEERIVYFSLANRFFNITRDIVTNEDIKVLAIQSEIKSDAPKNLEKSVATLDTKPSIKKITIPRISAVKKVAIQKTITHPVPETKQVFKDANIRTVDIQTNYISNKNVIEEPITEIKEIVREKPVVRLEKNNQENLRAKESKETLVSNEYKKPIEQSQIVATLKNEYLKNSNEYKNIQKSEYSFKDFVMLADSKQVVNKAINTQNNQNTQGNHDQSVMDTDEYSKNNLDDKEMIDKIKNALNRSTDVVSAIRKQAIPQTVTDTKISFMAQILEGFTGGGKTVAAATIKVVGTDLEVKSDIAGNVKIDDIHINGVLPVVISKDGYLNRSYELKNKSTQVELISENAVVFTTLMAGEVRQPDKGFIFGQLVSPLGEKLAGNKVEIINNDPVRVFYINENGFIDKNLNVTSSRGQFAVINAKPGQYYISTTDQNGIEKAPHMLNLSEGEGVIKKFSLGTLQSIKGIVSNAAYENMSINEANVQIFGSSKVAQTNKSGKFILKDVYVDCSDLNYIHVEKSGFYRNRVEASCSDLEQKYYIFPAAHTDSLAAEAQITLDPRLGMIIGNTSEKGSRRAQLWGATEFSIENEIRGYDYYFDSDGVVNEKRNRTSSKNGNFMILNAPNGFSYLQLLNKKNEVTAIWPVWLDQSTVNVFVH